MSFEEEAMKLLTSRETEKTRRDNIKMKFEKTLTIRTKLKRLKEYAFCFTHEDTELGKSSTFENPHFCKDKEGISWFALYMIKDKLTILMFHSYDLFVEAKK